MIDKASQKKLKALAEALTPLRRKARDSVRDQLRPIVLDLHRIYLEADLSLEVLGRELGRSPSWISQQFRAFGLTARSPGHRTHLAPPPVRLHDLNEHVFDRICSYEAAYFLGFLCADGNVRLRDGRPVEVRFRVASRDRDRVKFFRKFLGYSGKPKEVLVRGYPQVHLIIPSAVLARRLYELGIRPNRATDDLEPPLDRVPEHLHGAFWLGVFDGDGHVQRSRQARLPFSGYEVGLCGNRSTVTRFVEFVMAHLSPPYVTGFTPRLAPNGVSVHNWKVLFSGPRAIAVLRILYHPVLMDLAMKRKRVLVEALLHMEDHARDLGVRLMTDGRGRLRYTGITPELIERLRWANRYHKWNCTQGLPGWEVEEVA